MAYNPATDFLALWRNSGGNVSKLEVPGLDYVIAALARAGFFTLSVSATAPVVNQSTTAWLQTDVPSWSGEGAFFLWDKITTAYLPATAGLFLQLMEAVAGENGVSWWETTGGPPLNTVGNNGDFAIRTDGVGGIYGPKVAGAWPADPLPGTTNEINQTALDNTFGNLVGSLIIRGAAEWEPLPIGPDNNILVSAAGLPAWAALVALMDVIFTNVQGSILFRSAAGWADLPPGVADQVLASGGPGADPAWAPRTAEFQSGTSIIFQQTNAPVGWTKDLSINDYGLRVTSGAVNVTPGTAFSTVFAQTVVGNHTLTIGEMPSHNHTESAPGGTITVDGGVFAAGLPPFTVGSGFAGGNGAHNHTVDLTLSYVDVIIARKD